MNLFVTTNPIGSIEALAAIRASYRVHRRELRRLVEELAKLTGETLTGAVTQAVRERLDRLRRERGRPLADRLLLIGKDCAARLKEPFRSADHGDLLYDDRGLPQSRR